MAGATSCVVLGQPAGKRSCSTTARSDLVPRRWHRKGGRIMATLRVISRGHAPL